LRSLINIIPLKTRGGKIYYQARFFDKAGKLVTAKSLPSAKFWSEAYEQARDMLRNGLVPSVSKEDANTFKTLTGDEIKAIYNLLGPKGNALGGNPLRLRAFVAILLGLTGGLGVGEVIDARFEDLNFDTNLLKVAAGGISRQIPLTARVVGQILKLHKNYQTSKYIIPNIGDMGKPCDPIAIHRSLGHILPNCNIDYKARKIVYSDLRTAFISYLLDIDIGALENKLGRSEAIDYLRGCQENQYNYSQTRSAAVNFQINLEDWKITPTDIKWLMYESEDI
jgi:integrase